MLPKRILLSLECDAKLKYEEKTEYNIIKREKCLIKSSK